MYRHARKKHENRTRLRDERVELLRDVDVPDPSEVMPIQRNAEVSQASRNASRRPTAQCQPATSMAMYPPIAPAVHIASNSPLPPDLLELDLSALEDDNLFQLQTGKEGPLAATRVRSVCLASTDELRDSSTSPSLLNQNYTFRALAQVYLRSHPPNTVMAWSMLAHSPLPDFSSALWRSFVIDVAKVRAVYDVLATEVLEEPPSIVDPLSDRQKAYFRQLQIGDLPMENWWWSAYQDRGHRRDDADVNLVEKQGTCGNMN